MILNGVCLCLMIEGYLRCLFWMVLRRDLVGSPC